MFFFIERNPLRLLVKHIRSAVHLRCKVRTLMDIVFLLLLLVKLIIGRQCVLQSMTKLKRINSAIKCGGRTITGYKFHTLLPINLACGEHVTHEHAPERASAAENAHFKKWHTKSNYIAHLCLHWWIENIIFKHNRQKKMGYILMPLKIAAEKHNMRENCKIH